MRINYQLTFGYKYDTDELLCSKLTKITLTGHLELSDILLIDLQFLFLRFTIKLVMK